MIVLDGWSPMSRDVVAIPNAEFDRPGGARQNHGGCGQSRARRSSQEPRPGSL